MQVILISEVKTADLVSFYNAQISNKPEGKEIKKFADRPTAEKRVDDLVAYLTNVHEGWLNIQEGWMPAPEGYDGTELDDVEVAEEEQEDPEVVAARARASAGAFGQLVQSVQEAQKKAEETGEPVMGQKKSDSKASNSDGVAASWADNEVRASRLKRDGVSVEMDGQNLGVFKSTYEAFRALRLPNNKHIRFRLKLKESFRDKGEGATFEHNGKKYEFTIVTASE